MTSAPRARSLTCADELAHDLEVDVGLEQREADLAHGGVDVLGGELAVALETLHDALQAIGECIEHVGCPQVGSGSANRSTGGAVAPPRRTEEQGRALRRVRRAGRSALRRLVGGLTLTGKTST